MDRLATPRTMIGRRRAGLLIPALAILLGGCSAAATPSSVVSATSPASAELGAPAIGAPAASVFGPAIAPVPNLSTTSTGSASGGSSGSGSASGAIAYPYPGLGGSAGLAPDHELVVSGTVGRGNGPPRVCLPNRNLHKVIMLVSRCQLYKDWRTLLRRGARRPRRACMRSTCAS